jgi:hypothetical protein
MQGQLVLLDSELPCDLQRECRPVRAAVDERRQQERRTGKPPQTINHYRDPEHRTADREI